MPYIASWWPPSRWRSILGAEHARRGEAPQCGAGYRRAIRGGSRHLVADEKRRVRRGTFHELQPRRLRNVDGTQKRHRRTTRSRPLRLTRQGSYLVRLICRAKTKPSGTGLRAARRGRVGHRHGSEGDEVLKLLAQHQQARDAIVLGDQAHWRRSEIVLSPARGQSTRRSELRSRRLSKASSPTFFKSTQQTAARIKEQDIGRVLSMDEARDITAPCRSNATTQT